MNSPQQRQILHLTDNNRGGSQRHIIDLCRSDTSGLRHFILRVAPDVVGLHDVDDGRLLALDPERLTDGWPAFLRTIVHELDIGCIHAHALQPLLDAIDANPPGVDLAHAVVTLHDLRAIDPQFFNTVRPEPSADTAWIARCDPVLQRAGAVIVPSEWMAEVVRKHYPDLSPQVVENGIAEPLAVAVAVTPPWPASGKVFAVVGALGTHKGSETLKRVVDAIDDPDVVGVVIGYTEEYPTSGWAVPGKLYVHGRYQPEELAGLLAAYACRIVYFPNVVPESFSYVLSEVWRSGLPVVAPKIGALGARVERVGAGWLLADPLDARRAAALLVDLLGPAGDERIVAAKAALTGNFPVTDVVEMRSAIERLYRSIGSPSTRDPAAGWARVVSASRDARFAGVDDSLLDAQWPMLLRETKRLRDWNAKLVDDVRALKARNERIEADAAALESEIAAIRARNVALEEHVVALRARNLHVEGDVNALVSRNAQLEGDVVALRQRNIELDADVVALKERNTLVESGLASIKVRNAHVESDAAALQAELASTRERLSDIDRDLAVRHARAAELERALSILPSPLQNWLLRHAR